MCRTPPGLDRRCWQKGPSDVKGFSEIRLNALTVKAKEKTNMEQTIAINGEIYVKRSDVVASMASTKKETKAAIARLEEASK